MQEGDEHDHPAGDEATSAGGQRHQSPEANEPRWPVDHFRKQAEFDRLVFERAFKTLAWTVGASATVIVLAGGFFTFFGLSTYKSVELAANSVVEKAVAEIRPEVERRIRDEFETEAISALVKKEAEKRIAEGMGEIVEQAVQREIITQREELARLVSTEVERRARSIALEEAERSVKRAFAPRGLTDPQKITLIRELSKFQKQKVLIYYQGGVWEPHQFALQLSDVFKNAGWECELLGLDSDEPFRDLTLFALRQADGSMPKSYQAVLAAFRLAGMESWVHKGSMTSYKQLLGSPEMVTILVGAKVTHP